MALFCMHAVCVPTMHCTPSHVCSDPAGPHARPVRLLPFCSVIWLILSSFAWHMPQGCSMNGRLCSSINQRCTQVLPRSGGSNIEHVPLVHSFYVSSCDIPCLNCDELFSGLVIRRLCHKRAPCGDRCFQLRPTFFMSCHTPHHSITYQAEPSL
ncbi:hypothetical protein COO60DRAFT_890965 [Scenedesmus sp. NREL 46B-D3]|nr:hypothetical protein COO60DRAFT_890965 [Scenedesmus sp. NREL 46B-D3]